MVMKRRFYCRVVLALLGIFGIYVLNANSARELRTKFLPIVIDSSSSYFLQEDTCPACYGKNRCGELQAGRLTLTTWTRFTVSWLFNARNVYRGQLEGRSGGVVAKMLGHDWEMERSLHEVVCLLGERPPFYCSGQHYIKYLTEQVYQRDKPADHIGPASRSLTMNFAQDAARFLQPGSDYLGCVRSQDMMDFLTHKPQWHPSSLFSLENVLSMLLINPEPLVLTTFPAAEGWPFPEFLGSCGRVVLVEDCGQPLSEFLDSDFKTRVDLALQVLKIATVMTDQDKDLALYLTDWSLSNFAVDSKGKVTLIDLENIVVVNKTQVVSVGAPGSSVVHTSSGGEDGYALEDLCSHVKSDNNIYGACQWILYPHAKATKTWTRGLLYDIPQAVRSKHVLLEKLLRECSWPSHPVPGARMEAANQLRDILTQISSSQQQE